MKDANKYAPECFICSLEIFSKELLSWLDAGGDERLLNFSPLSSWQTVTKQLSAMQRRGETQHKHFDLTTP